MGNVELLGPWPIPSNWSSEGCGALFSSFYFVLSETKLCKSKFELPHVKLSFSHCFIVDRVGLEGGLALFWKEILDMSLLSFPVGHIDVFVKGLESDVRWFFMGVYRNPWAELMIGSRYCWRG